MKLLFVGDVMLGRLVNEALQTEAADYPWGDTLDIFKSSDWRACNLECALSDTGKPWTQTPKVFHFRSDCKNVRVLKTAGIDAVSLANNHALDFGSDALRETVHTLRSADIAYAGAGESISDATRPVIMSPKESHFKIGLIAFTDNEPDWEAKPNQFGTFFIPINIKDARAQQLFQRIKEIRAAVDCLIVSAHWGPNWGYEPLPEHRIFARALIDAGTDIVYGHSPHVFRGIEIYKRKAILYSTGDFVDDYAIDDVERNDESFIFIIEMHRDIKKILLYPTMITNLQARKAPQHRAGKIAEKMKRLCAELGTKALWREGRLQINVPASGALPLNHNKRL